MANPSVIVSLLTYIDAVHHVGLVPLIRGGHERKRAREGKKVFFVFVRCFDYLCCIDIPTNERTTQNKLKITMTNPVY